MNKCKYFYILLTIIMTTTFLGCNIAHSALVKIGSRNEDFEYIKDNEVDKIVIQSDRDAGFRFVVTDSNAIKDIYEILRDAKVMDEKTSLDPDYILEVHIGEEVKNYKYIVNLDEGGVGNFYDDENCYRISKNLDESIIQNLSFIRKPKNFEDVYYDCISEVLKKKTDLASSHSVAIDISGDVDCLKYMFSVDLLNFEKEIQKIIPGAKVITTGGSTEGFDTIITIKNKGYSTKIFKTTAIINEQKNKVYETYYVRGDYKYDKWAVKVSEPNITPDNW